MQNSIDSVSHWQPSGVVIMWKYQPQKGRENDDAWNLTADEAGCDSFINLIDRMIDAAYPVHRTIPLTQHKYDPREGIGIPFGVANHIFASKLRLLYSPDLNYDCWEAQFCDGVFSLSVGRDALLELRAGLAGLRRGEDDWSIGAREETKPEDTLWFWWYKPPAPVSKQIKRGFRK